MPVDCKFDNVRPFLPIFLPSFLHSFIHSSFFVHSLFHSFTRSLHNVFLKQKDWLINRAVTLIILKRCSIIIIYKTWMKTKLSEVPKNAEMTKAIEVFKNTCMYFYPVKEIWFVFTENGKFTCSNAVGLNMILHTCMVESGNPVHTVNCSRITTSG